MTLYDQIISAYPELETNKELFRDGTIILQNDGDGDYVREWKYEKPMPEGLPTKDQQ